MKNAYLNNNHELIITPSPTSSAADFNFLVGVHCVHHKKLKSRLTNSNEWIIFDGTHTQELLLNGIGNLEQQQMTAPDGKPMSGIALRLFNPETRLWSIYWADSQSGTLDIPMIGSFENNIGYFFSKDKYAGRPVLVQFKWDATDPGQPVWSQAFSTDNGITWEWNWYMYFTNKNTDNSISSETVLLNESGMIGVIELRNYLLKQGKRDAFINYFEKHFILSQEKLNAYPIGQYRIKGSEDNFCWIRGFQNMKSRSTFLPAFYYSDFWKQHRTAVNEMIVNNDNVYLLRPLAFQNNTLVPVPGIKKELLYPKNSIAVVDFYISNSKLEQLKQVFAKRYLPLLNSCDIYSFTVWQAELHENDFPALPVFQDKNLLVLITFYKDEQEYHEKIKLIESKMDENLTAELLDAFTIKHNMVLYPTEKTKEDKI